MVLTDALAAERCNAFFQLGFTLDQADDLARARDVKGHLVTVHDVRETLEHGCSKDLALAIYT